MDYYLYNPQTKLFYGVVAMDREKKKITLKDMKTGIEFQVDADFKTYKKIGYELLTKAQAEEKGLID